jgi:hypothetical protein
MIITMSDLIKSGFDLAPKNFTEAMDLAIIICNSQLCPTNYKGRKEDTLVAMMMGNELGLNPLQAIQNIAVINGKPSIYGDALMALVQNHHAFVSIDEKFDEEKMTATCIVTRKKGNPHTQTYTVQDAITANLWGKKGPWTQYPKRMLAMRARGFALRNQFADALCGLITCEEAEDMPIEKEINPVKQDSSNIEPVIKEASHYPNESFETNLPKWEKLISDGRKTAQDIITMVSSKAVLTDKQIKTIESIKEQDKQA